MSVAFTQTRQVEFAETDMAGIVHFTNFFRYMEQAEHAFLRSLGLSVHAEGDNGLIAFPRVEATCSYSAPLEFEETFEIDISVRERKAKSITYDFTFRKKNGVIAASGSLKTVCVTRKVDRLQAIEIPDDFAQAIDDASHKD